jgi:sugar/nucleoside kinase (ribokinase family)
LIFDLFPESAIFFEILRKNKDISHGLRTLPFAPGHPLLTAHDFRLRMGLAQAETVFADFGGLAEPACSKRPARRIAGVGKRVLAVGDVNMDLVFTGLDRIPSAEQETLARSLELAVGGQTGTVARAMSRLGLAVSFVGRVGDDEYGRAAVQALQAAGVSVSGVVVDPTLRTGTTVVLSTGTERTYITFAGSAAQARSSDVTAEQLSGADHLHVGSYYLQSALRPELPDLFQEARRRGLTTSLDPGWDPSREWGLDIQAVLPRVDVFLPNETEAMAITGTKTPEQALQALTGGGKMAVIKMGAAGCIAASGGEVCRCPAFPVQVVDVTSAGDIFDAGLLYGFLNGWSLAEAIRFASACGALAVARAGSGGIMSGIEQVREFLNEHSG